MLLDSPLAGMCDIAFPTIERTKCYADCFVELVLLFDICLRRHHCCNRLDRLLARGEISICMFCKRQSAISAHSLFQPAVWITLFIVVILALNIFAVGIYGEAEFIFASIKLITMVGLLILSFIIILGGGPNHDRLGFRMWKDPGGLYPCVGKLNLGSSMFQQ